MRVQVQYAGDGAMTKQFHGYKAKSLLRAVLRDTEFTPEEIRGLHHGEALARPGQVAEAIHYRGRLWVAIYDDTPNGRWDLFTLYLG